MVHHYKQIVFKIFIGLVCVSSLYGKDVPLMKTIEINIPVKEYSIIDFPFKIKDIQTKTFNYKTIVNQQIEKDELPKDGITFSKKTEPQKTKKGNDVLGLEKGLNVLTFKPKHIGYAEMIIWGYELFPMIVKVNVVEPENADKYIKFVEIRENKKEIISFESSSHEKIIEEITRHLYDEKYESKPVGYESIVKNKFFNVDVIDENKKQIGMLRNTLIREIIGRDYLGQVWNVNYIPNNEDDNREIHLYEEMFDDDGVYSVSLETYTLNVKEHGTRVMIVRRRD